MNHQVEMESEHLNELHVLYARRRFPEGALFALLIIRTTHEILLNAMLAAAGL